MRSSRDVIIQTPDIEAAALFYERVIGLHVFERTPTLIGIETGSFRLFIEPGPAPGPVFEFHAEDAATARAALLTAGCTITDEDPTLPRCYIKDPFGLTFNLARSPD